MSQQQQDPLCEGIFTTASADDGKRGKPCTHSHQHGFSYCHQHIKTQGKSRQDLVPELWNVEVERDAAQAAAAAATLRAQLGELGMWWGGLRCSRLPSDHLSLH